MFARLLKSRLAALLFAWFAALAVVAWLVLEGRQATLEGGQRATTGIATIVEQQTARTFQAIHLTLAAIAEAHERTPALKPHDPQFRDMMKRRLKDLAFVRSIYVVGANGRVAHHTEPNTTASSLADRPWFQAHRQDPGFAGMVWPPVRGGRAGEWVLPVTHPLGASQFEGVIVAAVHADQFREQFKDIGLPEGYLIAFFHLDGTLAATHPRMDEKVGLRYPNLPVFERQEQAQMSGSFWTTESLLPGERIVAYRLVQDEPFIVHVSRSKADILAEWQRTATGAGVAMLALTIFLAWFIVRAARESARRERERQQRAQAEKMEALGHLTGGIAHDFTNLLSIVTMNMALLRQRPADPALLERALATTERAVANGMRLVEQLLSFARRRPLAIGRVRLERWLEVARPLLTQAAGRGVTLNTEARPPMPEVLCDTGALDTAAVNLVINARDAMSGTGGIDVRAFPCDERSGAPAAFVADPVRFVCLSVRDTGPGMSEEVRRRALEPFYTTKGEAGTGLGLSQVYGFMQQVGGQLIIESIPGRGTAVHLFFPVAPAAASSLRGSSSGAT